MKKVQLEQVYGRGQKNPQVNSVPIPDSFDTYYFSLLIPNKSTDRK